MGYKVTRREFVRKRPEWMVSLLMLLKPDCYKIQATKDAAYKALFFIRQVIEDSRIQEKRSRLSISEGDGELSLVNPKGKPFIRFRVTEA